MVEGGLGVGNSGWIRFMVRWTRVLPQGWEAGGAEVI